MNLEAKHIYVSNQNPNLKLRISDEPEINIQFENAHFRTSDDKIAKLLDSILEVQTHVSQMVRKVDFTVALAAVKAHQQKMAQQNSATLGGTTGASMQAAKSVSDANTRNNLVAAGVPPEKVDALIGVFRAEHGLEIAQNVSINFDAIAEQEAAITEQHPPKLQPVQAAEPAFVPAGKTGINMLLSGKTK